MKITVECLVEAPLHRVWEAWTTPAEIVAWNAASDDWHTTSAAVDLRVGGRFTSRMEAKDGSVGFDFGGTYTAVDAPNHLAYVMDDGRTCTVTFTETGDAAVHAGGDLDAAGVADAAGDEASNQASQAHDRARAPRVRVTETFDAEEENPADMQRQGWQAILDRFAGYVGG